MNRQDYRLENGFVLKFESAVILGDACAPAMIIEKQPNGKYAVLGVSEVIAYPGFVSCKNKLLNNDFKRAYVLHNDLASAYLVLEDDKGWSLLRVDGDIRIYGGVVSTVSQHSYCSPLQLLSDCGFKFAKSQHSDELEIITPYTRQNIGYEDHVVCNGITPENILLLRPGDVFVFGSNPQGVHSGGAARMAHKYFGAQMGLGEGLQGQSYAIPTMGFDIETIRHHVDKFIEFARDNQGKQFFVTRIGCGIAGYKDAEVAPLFKAALGMRNINLPKSFRDILGA